MFRAIFWFGVDNRPRKTIERTNETRAAISPLIVFNIGTVGQHEDHGDLVTGISKCMLRQQKGERLRVS